MKKSALKLSLFLFIFFIFSLSTTYFTYAAGQGDIKPLSYVSCTLDDGSRVDNASRITLQPKFTLLFDKNVVDMLVWENNRKCISLSADGNANVAIDVSKIDDTVDFDHRQQIFVTPSNALKPDTTYHIYISPNLTAKNGVATLGGTTGGQGITITFKTKVQEVPQDTNTASTTNQSNSQQSAGGAANTQSNQESTPVAVNSTVNENTTSAVVTPSTTSENTTNATVPSNSTSENTTKSAAVSNTTGESTTNSVSQNSNQVNASDIPKTEENKSAEDSSKQSGDIGKENSEDKTVSPSEVLMGKSDSEDSSVKWMYFVTGIIVISWVAVEVIFRIRRIKGRSNKPLV